MSLDTWMDEFYPISAKTVGCNEDALSAARHSLRKWVGLRPENLERHGVEFDTDDMRLLNYNDDPLKEQREQLTLNYETCSLCWYSINKMAIQLHKTPEYVDSHDGNLIDDEGNSIDYCDICPGKTANHHACHSAYRNTWEEYDPTEALKPMLVWLSDTVKTLEPPAPPEENPNAQS